MTPSPPLAAENTGLWEQLAGSRILDLSHPYRVGMPQSPNHPPFRMLLERRHGDMVRADGGSAANELIVLGGHVGTHVDALAHVSQDGRVHGGLEASSLQSHQGFSRLGIDAFSPYVGRAVVLDVAALHGVSTLEPGLAVTVDDLRAARERADVDIRPGDVVLIGTGWSGRWAEKDVFTGQSGGAPGPDAAAGRWLADLRPTAVGAETIAFEHIPAGRGHAELPVHRTMLVEEGVHIIETMNLGSLLESGASEFLLVLNPLNVAGATGAPVRPLAVVPA
ncbi:cyclase family protein [Streptomyces sp. NBC_01754]|uniref:cyclase family protein n=1 Tax=Streptomyces sp. NBC_01754 TaxID=2975930 RepID=UPI002DD9A45D|nr:cyclase family protein [Streptomyces sp. NBC_01754]WSC91838.1 cyclase family protein [Streptomyces sp. NBC_01754]